MHTLIVDCETDNLLDKLTRIWTIQIGSADGTDVTVYADQPGYPPLIEAAARLRSAERIVGHNFFGFDMPAINRFYPGTVRVEQVWDTLVAARLYDPIERRNSLEEHGKRLGILKDTYVGDYSAFTPELVSYAIQDIHVTRALYHKLKIVETWGSVCGIEMRFAHLMFLQEQRGFMLDVSAAQSLYASLTGELAALRTQLQTIFPPVWANLGTFTPKRPDKRRGYTADASFTKVALTEFNPGSRQHCAKRLQKLGWVPQAFTPEGTPQVDETILNALPYPEAKQLARYLTVQKQIGQLSDGKAGWLQLVKPTGRVHGRVNSIGCAPGRCSHMNPNMAQVNKKDPRMRAVWIPKPGWALVGTDAEGLQARAMAHYLARYDGGAFAKRVSEGRKEDGSDVHSVNSRAISAEVGCQMVRDPAKHCLYACWFGASDKRLGWTLKHHRQTHNLPPIKLSDVVTGKKVRRALNKAIEGFEALCGAIQAQAKNNSYLRSPSGRRVPIRSQHSALVFLMQAVEADVMKLAPVIFHFERAPPHGWRYGEDYAAVAHVHDEIQSEARPEIAEELGAEMASCIAEAGVRLALRCPLAGAYSVGANWSATH